MASIPLSAQQLEDDDIPPLQPNAGGVVDPEDLVGREPELQLLETAVGYDGARLLGDRRIGKTSLLGKLEVVLREVGHTVIRVSAETQDPQTFSRWLVASMRENRAIRQVWGSWEKELGGELSVKVGQVGFMVTGKAKSPTRATPERDLLGMLAEATRRSGPQYRTILILDEVTVLAEALGRADPRGAEAFMHSLRAPRQQHPQVAMVIAGSVGLHHVIGDVDVVNDLTAIELGPLAKDDAVYLARRLLRGTGLAADREREVAQAIVDLTDGLPYYIQALVNQLATSSRSITLDRTAIAAAVDDALMNDRWQHSHYDTRLEGYYRDDAALVRHVLDAYALAEAPLSVDEVRAQVQVLDLLRLPTRDHLLDLIRKMEADHYLVRVGSGDRFASDLLRRAWIHRRRL